MAEKSITWFTPCCGHKVTLYYKEEEPEIEFEPPAIQRVPHRAPKALPPPRQRKNYNHGLSVKGLTGEERNAVIRERARIYRDDPVQKEKRKEYQRRWWHKKKRQEQALARETKRQHNMNEGHAKRTGRIEQGSMADAIHRYLATHADRYFKASELGHALELPNKRITSVLSQMIQRNLIVRRESEYGAWEYSLPK